MSKRENFEKAVRAAGFEPFETTSEKFSIYELKDGSYLMMRMNVFKIARQTDTVGNVRFNIGGNHSVVIISPKNLRGTPSIRPPTPQEIMASIVEDDVDFSVIEENWQTYTMTDNVVVILKLIPVKVSRTTIFDLNGEPVYNVNHQLLIKVNVPEELRKKGIRIQQSQSGHPSFIT